MSVNHYITLTRFKAFMRPRAMSPFRRVDGEWVTNDRPIRVRRVKGKSMAVAIKPMNGYASLLTADELAFAKKIAKRKGWKVTVKNADLHIQRYQHLDGDMDCNASLLDALERVGERLTKLHKRHIVIFIRSGKRELAEQKALHDRNMVWNGHRFVTRPGRPLTAFPDKNAPHIRGVAADSGIEGRDIGDFPGAVDAMRAEGVGLPVASEDWHAEMTDNMIGASS